MMHLDDCGAARAALSARCDGELAAAGQDALARHLRSCEACRAHERALERLSPGFAALRAAAPPPDLWRRLERRLPAAPPRRAPTRAARAAPALARAAAALAGFAAISALAFALERRADGPGQEAHGLARLLAASAGDTAFLAAQPELELLRQRTARSPR
jgi:predicted anti-sigma-YlaC factor YlaD